MPPKIDDPLMSTGALSAYLELSETRVREIVRQPGFPAPLPGWSRDARSRRWLLSEVLAFMRGPVEQPEPTKQSREPKRSKRQMAAAVQGLVRL